MGTIERFLKAGMTKYTRGGYKVAGHAGGKLQFPLSVLYCSDDLYSDQVVVCIQDFICYI